MAKQAVLKVSEGKTEEAIRGFLRSLLEKGLVEALLIPQGTPFRRRGRPDLDP